MLNGASLFYHLLCVGQIKLNKAEPTLQKTLLGWIIVGNINFPPSAQNTKEICRLVRNQELTKNLQKFWEIEHCFTKSNTQCLSKTEFAEQHFQSTTTRDSYRRFIVSIPFKHELAQLGTSRDMACKILLSMEKRMSKNAELKNQYVAFMDEYESLGHRVKLHLQSVMKLALIFICHIMRCTKRVARRQSCGSCSTGRQRQQPATSICFISRRNKNV